MYKIQNNSPIWFVCLFWYSRYVNSIISLLQKKILPINRSSQMAVKWMVWLTDLLIDYCFTFLIYLLSPSVRRYHWFKWIHWYINFINTCNVVKSFLSNVFFNFHCQKSTKENHLNMATVRMELLVSPKIYMYL